jgi:hypothetical protein
MNGIEYEVGTIGKNFKVFVSLHVMKFSLPFIRRIFPYRDEGFSRLHVHTFTRLAEGWKFIRCSFVIREGGYMMVEIHNNPYNRELLAGDVLEGWQNLLNVAAEMLGVPAGLITRVDGSEIEIFLASESQGNPYPAGFKTQFPDSGFYCEWVVKNKKPMLLPDARLDPMWKDNAAIEQNMVSYMGTPIVRPDGKVFGTICFLDSKEQVHNNVIERLVEQFKRMIELSLNVVYANEEIRRRDLIFAGLSKIFPICAYCKKVHNDSDEWVPVENYISGISGHRASHGICPQCYEREIKNI